MNAVTIGPLVFSAEHFSAITGILGALFAAELLGRLVRQDLGGPVFRAVLAGLVAARLGHVVEYWPGFAADPWRIPAFWQGGFSWPWAVPVVIAVVALGLPRTGSSWPQPRSRWASPPGRLPIW